MYRRDESIGKDPSIVQKTENFDLPVKILRSGKYKGRYKVPFGSHIWTCFSSDFFHADADEWREDAWDMIHERSDCSFFMITKRPERIAEHLPKAGVKVGSMSQSLLPVKTRRWPIKGFRYIYRSLSSTTP